MVDKKFKLIQMIFQNLGFGAGDIDQLKYFQYFRNMGNMRDKNKEVFFLYF